MASKINYQGKPFTHDPANGNQDIDDKYGTWASVWHGETPVKMASGDDLTGRDKLQPLFDLFGDCFDPHFERDHLDTVSLAPYKFETGTSGVQVNKAITHRLMWVLEGLSGMAYKIRSIGGHHLRYKNNTTTGREIASNVARYGAARKWYEDTYHREASDWMNYCLLFDLHTRPDQVQWRLISNHSFGTAVDINPAENGLNANTWDMPPEVVKLFRQAGFGWGGQYSSGKDAMHFEYGLPYVSIRPPTPQFPLCSTPPEEPPMRQFFNAEAGARGFFPVGTMFNLHTGVHINAKANRNAAAPAVDETDDAESAPAEPNSEAPAETPEGASASADEAAPPLATPVAAPAGGTAEPAASAVRALGPGCVVAARVTTPAETSARVNEFVGSSTCFVLLRHALRQLPEKEKKEDTKEVPFYSLYMHLEPVAADATSSPVPWLASLLRCRYGDVVNLDGHSPEFGQSRHLAAKTEATATEAPVVQTKQTDPERVVLKADNQRVGVVRPATDEMNKAVDALLAGKVVTFPDSMLPIQSGDAVGLLAQAHAGHANFLHWEIFAPADSNWIADLEELAGKSGVFAKIKESSGKDDNYLEPSELADLLAPHLTDAEQPKFREALGQERYRKKLRALINGATFFSTKKELDDAQTGSPPYTYPVSLDIKSPYRAQIPPPRGDGYKLQISFEPSSVQGTIPLTELKDEYTFTIQVPAETSKIIVKCKDLHVDQRFDVEKREGDSGRRQMDEERDAAWKNFMELTATRWRRVAVESRTEWRPERLKALLQTIKDKRSIVIEEKDAMPLAWYGRKSTDADPAGEWPVAGNSLFDGSAGALSADGNLVSVHPITGAWFFALLETLGKARLRGEWTRETGTNEPPFYWSVVTAGDPANPKHLAVAVSRIGVANKIAELLLCHDDIKVPLRGKYDNGVAIMPVDMALWGEWSLVSKHDTSAKPTPEDAQLTISLEKPSLVPSFRHSVAKKTGLCTMQVVFSEHAPAVLEGLMRFRVWQVKQGVAKPQGEGALSDVIQPVRGECALKTTKADIKTGQASLVWDPGDAFGQLLNAYKPSRGQKLLVRMELWVINGLDRTRFHLEEGAFNTRASELPAEAKDWLSDQEKFLASKAVSLVTLKPTGFGEMTSFLRLDKDGHLELVVGFPLDGDPAGWKKAAPIILKGGEEKSDPLPTKGNAIQRAFRVGPSEMGETLTFTARITKADAVFNGQNVEVQPRSGDVEVNPQLGDIAVTKDAHKVTVSVPTTLWPTNGTFRLECTATLPGAAPKPMRQGWVYAKPVNGRLGTIDSHGVFKASIPRTSLKRGATYDIRVVVTSKAGDGQLGGRPMEPLIATYTEGSS